MIHLNQVRLVATAILCKLNELVICRFFSCNLSVLAGQLTVLVSKLSELVGEFVSASIAICRPCLFFFSGLFMSRICVAICYFLRVNYRCS